MPSPNAGAVATPPRTNITCGRSRARVALIALAVAYAGVYCVMLVTRAGTDTYWFENVAFLPLYPLAGLGALLGAQRPGHTPQQRLGWRLIGAGWLVSLFGAWAYLIPPTAGLSLAADLLYKGYYPLLIVGFPLLADAEALRDRPVRALLELAIVAVAAFTMSWYFVWGPSDLAGGFVAASSGDAIIALGEVAVLVSAGIALIAPSRTGSPRPVELLGVGALLASIGDLLFASASMEESVPLRQLGAILLAVSATLFAISGLVEPSARPAGTRGAASFLPYAAIIAVGLLLVREAVGSGNSSRARSGLLLGAVVLTGLVLIRVLRAEREARQRAAQLGSETESRLALERQLRDREKLDALGLLAGGVAHDLNNILQVVRGNAELAQGTPERNAQEELQEILTATERGAALCRQLLLFGRPQPGERVHFVLSRAVQDLLPMLRRAVPTSIAIDIRDAAPDATIFADRAQVEVAILNLVMNARAAIAAEGRVTLELRATPTVEGSAGCVQLMVRDSGCGMNAETLARAVEPFFTTKGRQGSGLGLSTVLGTMRALGGDMSLRSVEQGGTEVTLSFPLSEGRVVTPAKVESTRAQRAAGARILVVDDEPGVRAAVCRGLARHGYVVLEASDGIDALELLERNGMAVDAVLSDINMPRLNGLTLATRLRERGATFPIILMTGYAVPEFERSGVPLGTHMLCKPFDLDGLATLLGGTLAEVAA